MFDYEKGASVMDELQLEVAKHELEKHSSTIKRLGEITSLDSRAAVQAGLFINGGAATAMLTFSGSLATKLPAVHLPHGFLWSIGFFSFGIASATFTSLLSYLANHKYYDSLLEHVPRYAPPYIEQTDQAKETFNQGMKWQRLAIASGLTSLACFLSGAAAAIVGFHRL